MAVFSTAVILLAEGTATDTFALPSSESEREKERVEVPAMAEKALEKEVLAT